jgi:hypothetical protein
VLKENRAGADAAVREAVELLGAGSEVVEQARSKRAEGIFKVVQQ